MGVKIKYGTDLAPLVLLARPFSGTGRYHFRYKRPCLKGMGGYTDAMCLKKCLVSKTIVALCSSPFQPWYLPIQLPWVAQNYSNYW